MGATRDRLHVQMLSVYGKQTGRICRDCVHLVDLPGRRPGDSFIACELASKKISWAGHLTACGKLEEKRKEGTGA